MSKNTVIKIENVSKMYDLGLVGTGTLSKDLNRTWAKLRGKPDPYATLAELNVRSEKSKSNTVWALQDINFEVKQGEVLGIIGKNGAGKSTLLKILSRITTPTTGIIKMKGRVGSLLEVGTGMHPEMTARQNVFLNGAIMGMTRVEIKRKLDEIVDFAGIGKYIDTPIKRFSSGMKVRLGFAVAAFLEPEILIVDEVLAVGDAEFQKKAIGKMQDVSKGKGRTVLFVSHNMASVKKLCSNGIVLENGKVGFTGEISNTINYYISNKTINNKFNSDNRQVKNNDVKITNVKIKNSNNESIDKILSGEKIIIEIVLNKAINENFDIGFGFYNPEEIPQFHCSTETKRIELNNRKQIYQATINKWPLATGKYYLNIYVRTKTTLLDYIKEAIWIYSEKGDFYNTGVLPSWSNGFYIDYDWE
jgi:lipopolysaccharide transport system ATP-binding protein